MFCSKSVFSLIIINRKLKIFDISELRQTFLRARQYLIIGYYITTTNVLFFYVLPSMEVTLNIFCREIKSKNLMSAFKFCSNLYESAVYCNWSEFIKSCFHVMISNLQLFIVKSELRKMVKNRMLLAKHNFIYI